MTVVGAHLVSSLAALEQSERISVREKKREADRQAEVRRGVDPRDIVVLAVELPEAIGRVDPDAATVGQDARRRGVHSSAQTPADEAGDSAAGVYDARGARPQPGGRLLGRLDLRV